MNKNAIRGKGKKGLTYQVHHESPFEGEYRSTLRFILIPYGMYYGDIPKNAGHGDRIRFNNEDEAEILSVATVEINTKLASTLCRMRYFTNFTTMFRMWIKRAQIIGAGRDAISSEQCLLVWHGDKVRNNKK
jgi:hypothetical protein